MIHKTRANLFATLLAATTFVTPALAQEAKIYLAGLVPQESAEERIRTSVKIKMRAQSISAATCHQQLGIEPSPTSTPLAEQIVEFEKYVTALTDGDASLNITEPEGRPKTLRAASLVTEAWTPVKAAAENIVSGNGQVADTDLIMVENLEILEHGHNFTAELVRQYANPAKATFADLLTIVVATRQGMLSQKMSKESCLVSYKGGDAAKKLGTTMDVYENTLIALRDGLPGAGIEAAPTAEIKAGLDEAYAQWNVVKPMLIEIKSGAAVDADAHHTKVRHLDNLMYKMVEISDLYVDHTKSKHN